MAQNFNDSPSGGAQQVFNGVTYTYNASKGVWTSRSREAAIPTLDAPPANPVAGDMYFDSTDLVAYVYYYDGSSSQWVQITPAGSSNPSGISVTTSSASGVGGLAYNSTTGVLTFTPAAASVGSAEVNNLQKDLSHLALLRAVDQTAAAYNLSSSFIEVFSDETQVATKTNLGYNPATDSYGSVAATLGTASTFSYTGSNQTYSVPSTATKLIVKAWGAGGGGALEQGGAGGFVTGTMDVTGSTTALVVVGEGGITGDQAVGARTMYGGGAAGGTASAAHGGAGGGLSGVFADNTYTQAKALIIAGGGGGGGANGTQQYGGSGGGLSGTTGGGTYSGGAASQTAGGTATGEGIAGSALLGGAHSSGFGGAGGGGGYYGGGGGNRTSGTHGGGGGGSGYTITGATAVAHTVQTQGTRTAVGTSDANYSSNTSAGGASYTTAQNGYVWIQPMLNNVHATGTLISTAQTHSSSVSKVSAVVMYRNNQGTATLNTDIKLSISADNGSTFALATLVAGTNFSSSVKTATVDNLTVTAGTQLKYKVEWANQASGSKETFLDGVALQW